MSEAEQRSATLLGNLLQGAYQITRVIGEGAMGTVLRGGADAARQARRRQVLARDLADNPEALARFQREIQVTAKLAPPNIVQVSDFGTVPTGSRTLRHGTSSRARDLEQRLARVTRLPLDSNAPHHEADGLGPRRHARPPGSSIVTSSRERSSSSASRAIPEFVKLVDFGVSKVLKASDDQSSPGRKWWWERPSTWRPSKPPARSTRSITRSDQWSFACIVWRMLVGQQPFVGADVNAVLHQVMNGEPPALGPGDRPTCCPRDIELVLRRALLEEPAGPLPQRYRGVSRARSRERAAAHLASAPNAQSAPARRRPGRPARRPPPRRTGAWMVLALLGAAVHRGRGPSDSVRTASPCSQRTAAPPRTAPAAKDNDKAKPTVAAPGPGPALKGRNAITGARRQKSDE